MSAEFGQNIRIQDKGIEKEPQTEWTSLSIASTITLFTAIQFTIYFSSLWPYLLQVYAFQAYKKIAYWNCNYNILLFYFILFQLDSGAEESFFGGITAIYSLGQAIMCMVFGYWQNKIQQCRIPILGGLVLMFLGNIVYLMCGLTMLQPKWTMFISRLITGLGAGVITVLRTYAVNASTVKDRSRSISLNAGSFAMGLTIGPGKVFYKKPKDYRFENTSIISTDVNSNKNWLKLTIQIIFTPLGYPGYRITSGLQLDMYTGVRSIHDFLLFPIMIVWQLWFAYVLDSPRCLLLPILKRRMLVFSIFIKNYRKQLNIFSDIIVNGSRILNPDPVGCRSSFAWCEYTPAISSILFISTYIFVVGPAFSFINVSMNTVFSTLLGPRNQGTMQGLLLVSGSIARMCGPIFISIRLLRACGL
uniref:MFS domain-containing protein n=1 Tax=Heterorhabditis bacteriophora TaxID=37862 RepID=A0A1I7XE34_HETBA